MTETANSSAETFRHEINFAPLEKALGEINKLLGATIRSFGDQLFEVTKETNQSFEDAAECCAIFAKQRLSVAEILENTKNALILSRLTGKSAVESVEILTAALNAFTTPALNSTDIINKLATADKKFGVSTANLADAITRAGASAQQVSCSLDQLCSLIGAATLAESPDGRPGTRGGAVIGNALKTIFVRLQRDETLYLLEVMGVTVKENGVTLPAIDILSNLANKLDQFSDGQKTHVTECLGGVMQLNVTKSILESLKKQKSTISVEDIENELKLKTFLAKRRLTLTELLKWLTDPNNWQAVRYIGCSSYSGYSGF